MNKEQVEGKFGQLKGKLKEHYGLAKEDAEVKIKALETSCCAIKMNKPA